MPKISGDDLIQLARESKKLNLQAIHLIESHCKRGDIKPGKLPRNATQTITLEMRSNDDASRILTIATVKIVATYADADDGDPALSVSASFGIHYKIEKRLVKKTLERTLRSSAQMIVWPYWREFLQSMTVRMGLPPFPVPLLSVTSTFEETQDTAEDQ